MKRRAWALQGWGALLELASPGPGRGPQPAEEPRPRGRAKPRSRGAGSRSLVGKGGFRGERPVPRPCPARGAEARPGSARAPQRARHSPRANRRLPGHLPPEPASPRPLPLSRKRSSRAADGAGTMVLDSVARIVKVQLPAYLKQLPVPESITGFARLTGKPPAPGPSPRAAPWGWGVGENPARGGAPGPGT